MLLRSIKAGLLFVPLAIVYSVSHVGHTHAPTPIFCNHRNHRNLVSPMWFKNLLFLIAYSSRKSALLMPNTIPTMIGENLRGGSIAFRWSSTEINCQGLNFCLDPRRTLRRTDVNSIFSCVVSHWPQATFIPQILPLPGVGGGWLLTGGRQNFLNSSFLHNPPGWVGDWYWACFPHKCWHVAQVFAAR